MNSNNSQSVEERVNKNYSSRESIKVDSTDPNTFFLDTLSIFDSKLIFNNHYLTRMRRFDYDTTNGFKRIKYVFNTFGTESHIRNHSATLTAKMLNLQSLFVFDEDEVFTKSMVEFHDDLDPDEFCFIRGSVRAHTCPSRKSIMEVNVFLMKKRLVEEYKLSSYERVVREVRNGELIFDYRVGEDFRQMPSDFIPRQVQLFCNTYFPRGEKSQLEFQVGGSYFPDVTKFNDVIEEISDLIPGLHDAKNKIVSDVANNMGNMSNTFENSLKMFLDKFGHEASTVRTSVKEAASGITNVTDVLV